MRVAESVADLVMNFCCFAFAAKYCTLELYSVVVVVVDAFVAFVGEYYYHSKPKRSTNSR